MPTVALRKMNYAVTRFGGTGDVARQAAVMLYVHSLMGDGAPGEASPSGLGGAVAQRYAAVERAASRYAGPYTVTATTDEQLIAGRKATLTVRVRTAGGRGVPSTKVRLKTAGAELPATVTTNARGDAAVAFTPTDAATDLDVTASTAGTAAAAPRLFVPTRGRAARNGQRLVAAKSQAYSAKLQRDVATVTPTVTTAATPGVVVAGQTTSDAVTVSGPADGWKAPTEVRLYGPFRSRDAVSCTGAPAATTSYEATLGDSTTPPVKLDATGVYAYQLVVAATPSTEAVTTPCPDPAELVQVEAQPVVGTQVSAGTIQPGQTITDTVAVSGLQGESATIDAALHGPFGAADRLNCDGTPVWTGVVEATGDGSYVTDPVTLATPGYYTYREGLRAGPFVQPYLTPCGEAAETTIVRGAPQIVTQVSAATVAPGTQLTDTAVVTGLGELSAPVRVELWGPYPSREAMTCEGTPAHTSTFTADGDGSYVTEPATVDRAGYYTYREAIDATAAYDGVQTPCGEAAETSFVQAAPKITTKASDAVVRPGGSITDRIAVTGLGKTPATIEVELYGPYESKADMDCEGTPYRTGSVKVDGDGVVRSSPMQIKRAGFFVFRERIAASPGVPAYQTECAVEAETSLGSPQILTGRGDGAVRTVFAAGKDDDRVEPTRVRLGRLGVDAPVSPIGIDLEAGALGISKDIGKVGWWRDGAAPGSKRGATLLAGHVDSAKRGAGAFYPLKGARRGDVVTLGLQGGGSKRYRVTSVRRHRKDALPDDVYSTTGPARLVLVTCGGPFLPAVGHYRDNVIVTARPL